MLSLLDGFSINSAIPPLSPRSPLRILVYLVLRGPSTRDQVEGALWPDATQQQAQGALRSAIWRLQHEFPGLVEARRSVLTLGEHVRTDVGQMMALARSILETDSAIPGDFGLLLRDNELTPAWHDEWIVVERERLSQLRLEALDILADQLLAAGRPTLALQVGMAALKSEPLRESSCQRVISAYLLQDNRALARQRYDMYRALLYRELGIDPSPKTTRLLAIGSDK